MNSAYDHKKFAILFVDDEEQARKYFRMALEPDFRVFTAASVEEAWTLLNAEHQQIGLIVTDQRMPHYPGTELLARARRAFPHVMRILTTAFADLDAAIEAVNSGAIYKYIVKPWDMRELRITLLRALEHFMLAGERDALVEEKLSSLEHLLAADRVRSLAILAQSLSSQFRNTNNALYAYVSAAQTQMQANPALSALYREQRRAAPTWEATTETRVTLKLVQSIAAALPAVPGALHEKLDVAELARQAWSAIANTTPHAALPFRLQTAATLPIIHGAGVLLSSMFQTLLQLLVQAKPLAAQPGVLSEEPGVTFSLAGAGDQVVIEISRTGLSWDHPLLYALFGSLWTYSDAPLPAALLAAFFIAHHHGGNIGLSSSEVGFKITLPQQPAQVTTRPANVLDLIDRMSQAGLVDQEL